MALSCTGVRLVSAAKDGDITAPYRFRVSLCCTAALPEPFEVQASWFGRARAEGEPEDLAMDGMELGPLPPGRSEVDIDVDALPFDELDEAFEDDVVGVHGMALRFFYPPLTEAEEDDAAAQDRKEFLFASVPVTLDLKGAAIPDVLEAAHLERTVLTPKIKVVRREFQWPGDVAAGKRPREADEEEEGAGSGPEAERE